MHIGTKPFFQFLKKRNNSNGRILTAQVQYTVASLLATPIW